MPSHRSRCSGWCFMAFGLLGIFVTVMLMSANENTTGAFEATLDTDQKETYEEIVRMRSNLFLKGLVVGVLVTGILIAVLTSITHTTTDRLGCFALTSVLLITCIYYHVAHKSDYMVRHLKTREQTRAYLEVHRRFTRLRHIGFLLGIGFYLLFGCLFV